MHLKKDLCNFARSILKICFLCLLPVTSSRNIATEHVTYLRDPRVTSAHFGYSLVAQQRQDVLTLWVGAPKYSAKSTSSTAKEGAVFQCEISTVAKKVISAKNFRCSALDFRALEKEYSDRSSVNPDEKFENNFTTTDAALITNECLKNSSSCGMGLPNHSSINPDEKLQTNFTSSGTALSTSGCLVNNSLCGFSLPNNSTNFWISTKISKGMTVRKRYNLCHRKDSIIRPNSQKKVILLTGPPQTNDLHFLAILNKNVKEDVPHVSILVSPLIQTRKRHVQCLRFCFNAFLRVKNSKRFLRVWMQYDDPTIHNRKYQLFNFSSPTQEWSLFWNHTEINIHGLYDNPYKIYFEATVFGIKSSSSNMRCRAKKTAAIAISDINVSNLPCEEEESNVDEIIEEQSIGITLKSKDEENDQLSLTSCAPLWQQNCGYAREANGICFELLVNGTQVKNVKSLKPPSQKCIRGKIDIVLVVDQSGSVNQCNFQKVKRWLRNIVRSFNIGKDEQDVGVVVYSSKDATEVVVHLGFQNISNGNKKENTINKLKNLPYAAGSTFTGYAFARANEELSNARKDSKKIIILLTDGETSKIDQPQLKYQSKIARNRNVTILAVGVGNFKKEELDEIAGNPKNVFSVRKFSELEKVRDKLKGFFKLEALEGGNTLSNTSDAAKTQQCQMGFSIHYSQDSLLLGSPGCYHMSGNVILYQKYNNDSAQEGSAYVESQNGNEQSGGTTYNPVTGANPPDSTTSETIGNNEDASVDGEFIIPSLIELQNAFSSELSDSYLGYAITSGYFYGVNKTQLTAASAPKYKGRGAVFLYESIKDQPIKEQLHISAQQFGEYFGAVLCADDLNFDGFTDLLIGAPLHTGFQPDEGVVYVYMGALNMSSTPNFILKGDKVSFSRFGSYVSAAGDLNRDGYKDIAVSAPLEEKGAVYIFHGNAYGINERYAQKINPQHLNPLPPFSWMRFGPTVVGNIDVDQNGYPDLLIGSPKDDAVCILLSRPVVHIDANLNTTQEIDALSPECRFSKRSNSSCFNCSICFSYSGMSIHSDVGVDFSLIVDADQRPSRFGLRRSLSSSITSSMLLTSPNTRKCQDFAFILKAKTRDLMTSVKLKLAFHLASSHKHHIHNTTNSNDDGALETSGDTASVESYTVIYNNYTIILDDDKPSADELVLDPIMDSDDKQLLVETINFKTYCNAVNKCKADISLATKIIGNSGEQIHEIIIGTIKTIQLRVALTNLGPENAYDVELNVSFPSNLYINTLNQVEASATKYGMKSSNDLKCFEFNDVKAHTFHTKRRFMTVFLKPTMQEMNQSCTFDIVFGILPIVDSYEDKTFHFNLNASSISEDINLENGHADLHIPVRYQGELLVDGVPRHQLVWARKNITDDFQKDLRRYSSPVQNNFIVMNTGNLALPGLKFVMKWPAYVWITEQHKFDLFYVQNLSCSSSSEEEFCDCNSGDVFDSHEMFSYSNPTSVQNVSFRDISEAIEECADTNSKCYIDITCDMGNMLSHAKVNISIKSLVSPHIMLNIKKPAPLIVEAYVSLDANYPINIVSSRLAIKVTNKLKPISKHDSTGDDANFYKLPWWVILISVLASLFFLACLILLLKKGGFFTSKYKLKIEEAEKQREEATPLNK